MDKTLHFILTLITIFAFSCTSAMASTTQVQEAEYSTIDNEPQAIAATVEDNTLHIKNAEGMIVEIYSITGEKVYNTRIDSANKTIELQGIKKGCYIIRIGKFTRKIYIN